MENYEDSNYKLYDSTYCGKFYIIKRLNPERVIIKFVNTGTEMEVSYSQINKGSVKDRYCPTIFGVGYLGNAYTPGYKKEYRIWYDMLRKCYDITYSSYYIYGGKGARVCERWLCFEYYLEDLKNMYNYDRLIGSAKKYTVHRRIKKLKDGNLDLTTEFSKHTCYIGLLNRNPIYKIHKKQLEEF